MNRLSIKLTLDEARFFDALKVEEVINKDRIKALYKAGHPIKGVSELQYIQVTEKKDAKI